LSNSGCLAIACLISDGGDDLYICHKCGHDNNPDLEEGSCGYDTDVATGKKLDTPGGLEEGRPKNKDPKKGTGIHCRFAQ